MYLTPVPGSDRTALIQILRAVENSLINIRSRSHVRADLLVIYSQWAGEAVRLLRGHVRDTDIDGLVLTRRYWALQAATASTDVATIIDVEIDERRYAFAAAIAELERQHQVGLARSGHVVVPDTNVFCQHPDKIEDLDFAGLLGLRDTPIRLMIPIVVIDELDALKGKGQGPVRWRAAYSLAFLDKHLDQSGYGVIRDADFSALTSGGIPRGRVSAEVVLDPPRHVRLPINDDEIIDRAAAIQASVGRELTLITYDTGMCLRARIAGLEVHKVVEALDAEPRRQ
ncbi:PIN domain-containing protein [Nocardioides jiangxiensis]|uniref:PIN domain-containing protein n=1 Tax=Nocardioides jiangxiensis TaxID=3064524 RepID=A0ABT9B0B2_9ACTN|nr:PIN domain-containing protein [Nocardioides sp. WY-20]MDO7868180.1 PIN domain-containing protein [Nocardioides sp. WY-20]